MTIVLGLALITASPQEVPSRLLGEPPILASGDHQAWPIPDSGWVEDALFLSDGRIAVLDGASQRTYVLNPADGVSTVVGGPDYDPGEVTKFLRRLPNGGVVTIDVDGKLVAFRRDASVDFTSQLGIGALDDAIGVLADGHLVIRHTVRPAAVVPFMQLAAVDTVFRRPLEFSKLGPLSAQRTSITEATSGELASVTVSTANGYSSRTYRPIFGHRTMADVSDETLIIAQTDLNRVTVYDMRGVVVGRIPLPEPTAVEVTDADIDAQRLVRLAEQRVAIRARQHALSKNERFASIALAMAEADSLAIWTLPASRSLPTVDRVLADASHRLWIRHTALPGASRRCWQVWDLGSITLDYAVVTGVSDRLLDAWDNLVLLYRQQGELDVEELVVTELVARAAGQDVCRS